MRDLKSDGVKEEIPFDSTGNPGHNFVAGTEFLVFKRSPIHGTGGFARVNIKAGTQVIEYVGERITKAQSLEKCQANNSFIFAIDDAHDLDGNVEWNPARFVNHSCAANCEAQLVDGRIWIVAVREIRIGEEITFNYGYDLEDYREHQCVCGAANCAGYIVAEEFFAHLSGRKQIGEAQLTL